MLGSPPLRPISWRVWAGMIERGAVGGAAAGEETNPFLALENRVAFWDVRVCLLLGLFMGFEIGVGIGWGELQG